MKKITVYVRTTRSWIEEHDIEVPNDYDIASFDPGAFNCPVASDLEEMMYAMTDVDRPEIENTMESRTSDISVTLSDDIIKVADWVEPQGCYMDSDHPLHGVTIC